MPIANNQFGALTSVLGESIYFSDDDEYIAFPGLVKGLATEDIRFLTTEDGRILTTEG